VGLTIIPEDHDFFNIFSAGQISGQISGQIPEQVPG
jgi:hypothetical protein